MPDSKITALTSISTSTDPANDPLVIVDVSDTSMAATGTTKKVTLNQLLGASGTATLASATITGDLTVDTDVLKVDSTNNRVGIGTASPQQNLHVVGTGTTTIAVERSGATIAGRFEFVSGNSTNLVRCVTAKDLVFEQATGTEVYRISSTGVATWSNVGGVAGTAMTLNSTGLGVGVASPAQKLDVAGSIYISNNAAYLYGKTSGGLATRTFGINAANDVYVGSIDQSINNIRFNSGGGDWAVLNSTGLGVGGSPNFKLDVSGAANSAPITLLRLNNTGTTGGGPGIAARLQFNAGATALGFVQGCNFASGSIGVQISGDGTNIHQTIDSSGNVGIGVTPSAWAAGTYKSLQIGQSSSISAGVASELVVVGSNCYFDTTDSRWERITSGYTSQYYQTGGTHVWRIGGTAGANTDCSFTSAMTLDASGNLLVGTTTASGRVAVDTDLATYNGMAVKNTGTTYGASSFFFRFINSSGATAGSIQHTAVTTTNYSTTSDARLKESKGISTDTSVIDNTVVHDFVWKADGSTDRGVFAQEAHAVKPRAVSVGSDELTEDGNIKTPWSVDYSKFVPDLIVYCQQLKKQVVELTARVQTLETR